MSAPVMQLRAKGPQDVDLISEPEVTFFRASYPRHTNFAFEDIDILQSSGVEGFGNDVSFTLTRSGDLVSQLMLYFRITPPTVQLADGGGYLKGPGEDGTTDIVLYDSDGFKESMWAEDLGRALIEKVSLSVGGYEIESQTGDFLHFWDRLSRTQGRSFVDTYPAAHGGARRPGEKCTGNGAMHIYVPLSFSFSAAASCAIPMIALQYHDVKVRVSTRSLDSVSRFTQTGVKNATAYDSLDAVSTYTYTPPKLEAPILIGRYIFLDDAERREFAMNEHTYLMTENQTQEFSLENLSTQSKQLFLNHPVKALYHYWTSNENRDRTSIAPVYRFWDWTMGGVVGNPDAPEAIDSMNLSINQQRMFGEGRDALYFRSLLNSQFHTRVPGADGKRDIVHTMPFALDPESWKPTGSINMSRIDTIQLMLDHSSKGTTPLPAGRWIVTARSFNSLRIRSGMGGRRYAS